MATIAAKATGNWSNGPVTWTGNIVPAAGDVADLNGFDVTLDVASITCTRVQNTGGGTLAPALEATINANILNITDNIAIITTGGVPLHVVGDVENDGNNTGSVVPNDGTNNTAAIIAGGGDTLTIVGNLLNKGTAASAVNMNGADAVLNVIGNGTNGQIGSTTIGAKGSAVAVVTTAVSSVHVTISGDAVNWASAGQPVYLGANPNGPAFLHVDVAGNWTNNDATASVIPFQISSQSILIIRGDARAATGKKIIDYGVASGGTVIILGKAYGDLFIDNYTLITSASTPQGNVNSDGGVWIVLGDPRTNPNFTYGTGDALVMSVYAGRANLYYGTPLGGASPTISIPSGVLGSVATQLLRCMGNVS